MLVCIKIDGRWSSYQSLTTMQHCIPDGDITGVVLIEYTTSEYPMVRKLLYPRCIMGCVVKNIQHDLLVAEASKPIVILYTDESCDVSGPVLPLSPNASLHTIPLPRKDS